jgi:glycerol uptake facilitator-like aquaporin
MYAPFANFFVPFVHYAGLFVVQASIFAVFGTGNPALSIVFGIAGKYRWMDVLYSVLGSTIGWVLATFILRGVFFSTSTIVASIPVLQPGVTEGFGFGVELFMSLAWGLTIFFYINKPNQDQMISLGLFASMVVAWPLTRGAMNPHRVFGPLIGISAWDTSLWQRQLLVYAFAHFFGFLAAFGIYYTSFSMMEDKCKKEQDTKQKACAVEC